MLTESDVVHVKGLTVDGLIGLSAVSQAARVLGLSDELVKHALALLRHGRARTPAPPASCASAMAPFDGAGPHEGEASAPSHARTASS